METFKPKKLALKKMKVGSIYKTAEWQKYRYRFLHYNPICYCCGAKSNVVDHIIAHKGNVELFESTKNHMALCDSCHSRITQLFDLGTITQDSVNRKAEYIATRRSARGATDSIHILPYYRVGGGVVEK